MVPFLDVKQIPWMHPCTHKRMTGSACDVLIDFEWATVIDHGRPTLRGLQDLSQTIALLARSKGAEPALLLSDKAQIPFHWLRMGAYCIAVVHVVDFVRSTSEQDRAASFFLNTFTDMYLPLPASDGNSAASRVSTLMAALERELEGSGDALAQALGRGGAGLTSALLDATVAALSRSAKPEDLDTIVRTFSSGSVEVIGDVAVAVRRRKAIAEFELELAEMRWSEASWQDFFHRNAWILGHGTDYVFGEVAVKEAMVRAPSVRRTDGRSIDFLMLSVGAISFVRLVEVKLPDASLVNREYRNGIWLLSKDVVGGTSQTLAYCRDWQDRHAKGDGMKDAVTVRPQGVLIVGLLKSLEQKVGALETFEEFRRTQHGVTVLCFDELLERAKHMVSCH